MPVLLVSRVLVSALLFDVLSATTNRARGRGVHHLGSYFATKTAYRSSPRHDKALGESASQDDALFAMSLVDVIDQGRTGAEGGLSDSVVLGDPGTDHDVSTGFVDADHTTRKKQRSNLDFHIKPNWPQWCSPIQVNTLIRHGIRNAGRKEIERFTHIFSRISGHLKRSNNQLYKSMENLLRVVHGTEPKHLLNEGRVEQQHLAQRIFTRYSTLFENDNAGEDLLFVSSTSSRAIESCDSFRLEWQRQLNSVEFHGEVEKDDSLLRFFDHCNKYIREVEERKKITLKEYYKYVNNNFREIAAKVTAKLNLDEASAIQSKEVKSLYILAAIELVTLGTSSLADLFDEESLKMLEYSSDLKQYWKKSYGHAINYEQSCPLLVDMINHLDYAVQGQSYKRGIFRFAHAETMLPLQALLGLFKDETRLEANNYHLHHDRHFKTGIIAPFSGNLQIVLFECDTELAKESRGNNGLKWERHMVQLLVNEVPERLPDWPHEFCPYSVFKDRCQTKIDSCDIESICNIRHSHEEL